MLRALVLTLLGMSAARAEEGVAEDNNCGNGETDIATDRPDVTNSSQVVPRGSVQLENGINWTTRPGAYRFTPTQQIDIRVGIGLNRAAPDHLFAVGYSFRFDDLI